MIRVPLSPVTKLNFESPVFVSSLISHKMASSAVDLPVNELERLAEEAFDAFSPGVAAKYYEQAIAKRPDDALLHHKLALMYIEHGEPENAHKISDSIALSLILSISVVPISGICKLFQSVSLYLFQGIFI